jgi:multiple sugar transport system permease protein
VSNNRLGRALRRSPQTARKRQGATAWLLLLPAVVFFAVFFFIPIFSQLYTSLFTGVRSHTFVGLGNFQRALGDPSVLASFITTVIFAAGSLVIGIVLGLTLAVILNQALPGRTLFRAILLVPYLTSVAIIGLLWRNILDPQVGILNRVLEAIGVPSQSWLTTQPLAVIIGIAVWSSVGYTMVLFLAGLQGIPSVYYEAARIDGASPMQRFLWITLPLLAPTTLFVSMIGVITSLQQFALPYIVTGGGPGDATSLYAFRVFNVAFSDSDFSYASALSFLLLLVILALSLVQMRVARRGVD